MTQSVSRCRALLGLSARGRAPLPVAEHLHAAIAGSTLIVLPGVGHVCNLEAAETFIDVVRTWLAGQS